MARGIRAFLVRDRDGERSLPFMLALLIVVAFVLPSLGLEGSNERLYADVAFSLLLIVGVIIASAERKVFILAALVTTAALGIRWGNWFLPSGSMAVWRELATVGTILLFSLVILAQVVRPGPVTAARLQGAVVVYLLLGIGWANVYAALQVLQPGAFQGQHGPPAAMNDWMYLSFVTLTTVGYGDIVPVHRVARTLAIGEALTGQLYIAVLLARLVSLEVSARDRATG